MPSVRPATPADIHPILALEREAATAAHWTQVEYERIFTAGQTPRLALVVADGGEVLGFLVARTLGPDWELENVVTAPVARRRGLASQLILELLEVARQRGAESVHLEVRESNQQARALYRKLGFRESGRRRSYYSNPIEDALVYSGDVKTSFSHGLHG